MKEKKDEDSYSFREIYRTGGSKHSPDLYDGEVLSSLALGVLADETLESALRRLNIISFYTYFA